MTDEQTAVERVRTLARLRGVPIDERTIATVAGAYRTHEKEEQALDSAKSIEDQPADVFVPIRRGVARSGRGT